MLEEMDRIPKTRLDSSMIRILPNPQERIRLERLEEIFHSGLHKIVNMIGDNNTNPVILQRLRAFLFMYIKRVGVRFFHEVMSTEEGVIRFLKLIVERMRFAMLNSHTDSKRVTSPSDTFLIPRGGPDATITPHYHRRYQPYAQQQYRLQIPVHPAVETFSQGIPPNVFAESCRSPYKDMVPNNFGDGNRHWNNHPVSQSPRLPIREDNITLDLDSIQDFSSDLLEFLNNTSVLPELNFNTDLDFSVVRDDLDAMERCLYVRSNPGSDFTASSSSVCSSASQSPPTPRHIFPNNIRSDDRGSFYSDSESSEMSVQVVPNILYDRSDDERNLMSNLERSDCSNSNSPVMAMNELYSPSGRFLSSPLSTHMGQLTVNTHEVELKSQKKTMISAHPNDLSVGVSQPLHVNFNNFICVDDNMTGRHGVSPELKHQPAVKSHRRDNTDSFPPKKPMNPSDKQTTEACIPEEKQKSIYPFEYRSAREEILAMLDPTKKEEFVKHVAKLPEKDLLQIDDDGDTQLMILVSSEEQFNYAQLYALVERLKHYPQLFLVRNKQGLTALFMAMWRNRPIVAGYLAETMAELSLDLGVTFKKGNTLFHYIATVGDDMTTILAYLARIKKPNGKQAVNFNVHNHNGRTVIHEAIMRHGTPMSEENGNRKSISCLKIIEIMCAYGADPGEGDRTSCKGAIHAALEKRDLKLLELLLSASPASANAKMYNNNTPLHYAATLPNIKEDEQFNIIRLLLEKGADKTIRNSQKKLPIELVCQEHQKVKMLLQARAKKQFRLLCSQSNKDGTSKS